MNSTSGGISGAPYVGSATYANIVSKYPAASFSGYMALATDLGAAPGTYLVSNGARWRPMNGRANIAQTGAVAGITNTETIVCQTQLPIGLVQAGDTFRVHFDLTKSGTTDTINAAVRMGTAGTTADTVVLASRAFSSTTVLALGGLLDIKIISNTSAQALGSTGATSTPYSNGGSAAAAAVTISDLSANSLWFSFSIADSAATNTVGSQSCTIEWIA